LENYVSGMVANRQKDIEDIMYLWLTQSRNSDVFSVSDNGKKIINIDKTQSHFKLVKLYNLILKNDYPYKEGDPLVRPEPRSISPKYNAKVLRDFDKKVTQENKRRDSFEEFVSAANKIINELNLNVSISSLKSDFDGDRIFMKNSFQNIFRQYGIELHDKVATNIFGKVKFMNERNFRDTIQLFTKNTAFNYSLRHQFSTTNHLEANGIFSAFFMRAAGLLERRSNQFSFEPRVSQSECDNNPFCEEKKVIRILASAVVCTY